MPVTLKVLMSGLPCSSISTSMFTSNAVRAAIADVGICKSGLAPRETISGGSSRGGCGAALAQAVTNAQAAGSRESRASRFMGFLIDAREAVERLQP